MDTHHSLKGRHFELCPKALEITNSTPEIPKGNWVKLSLGKYGAMVTEALTTGSGEQVGPRGALRHSPKGTSGGKQTGRLASSALLSCQEVHSPVLVTDARGGQNHRTPWLMLEGPPHTCWHVLLLLLLRTAIGR